MKCLAICLYVLMISLPAVTGSLNEDNPPLLTVKNIKLEEIKLEDKNTREARRVAAVEIEENKEYIARFDPPDHCSHIIVCSVNDKYDECGSAAKTIVLKPQKVLSDGTEKVERVEDKILISKKGGTITLIMNPRNLKLSSKLSIELPTAAYIRIEMSSFYCNFHIGTVGSVDVPTTHSLKLGEEYSGQNIDLDPFPLGQFASANIRKCFGPLFRPIDEQTQCEEIKFTKEIIQDSQCPFSHDWIGFSRWTERAGEMKDTFWNSPIYQYYLTAKTGCGTSSKPWQLDIEIGNPFDPTITKDYKRCFGFALVFGDGNKFEAKNTFEFYLVASMFLAPDSDKIRSIRIQRDSIKKIRLSFFNTNIHGIVGKINFATIEYDFLNDNTAGVREYVELPAKFDSFKTVTLLSEGYCEVRVLNVENKGESTAERCCNLAGCEVLKIIK